MCSRQLRCNYSDVLSGTGYPVKISVCKNLRSHEYLQKKGKSSTLFLCAFNVLEYAGIVQLEQKI